MALYKIKLGKSIFPVHLLNTPLPIILPTSSGGLRAARCVWLRPEASSSSVTASCVTLASSATSQCTPGTSLRVLASLVRSVMGQLLVNRAVMVWRLTWQLGGPGVGGGHDVQGPHSHLRGLGVGHLIHLILGVVSHRVVTLVNSSASILVTYFVVYWETSRDVGSRLVHLSEAKCDKFIENSESHAIRCLIILLSIFLLL